MNSTPDDQPIVPPEPTVVRRRLRIVGEHLQAVGIDPLPVPPPVPDPPPRRLPVAPAPAQPDAGPVPPAAVRWDVPRRVSAPAPAAPDPFSPSPSALTEEVTGFFRHLHDTAQSLSQQIGRLTGAVGGTPEPSSEHRPLPRNQRRPQRLDPGSLEAKRSVRFTGAAAATAAAEEEPPGASREKPVATDLPNPELPGAKPFGTDEPWPTTFEAAPFTPRHGNTEAGDASELRVRPSWTTVLVVALLGGGLGWLLRVGVTPGETRPMPPGTVPSTEVPRGGVAGPRPDEDGSPASVEAMRLLDLALDTEKKGQPDRAAELLQQAQSSWPQLVGINYRLALLALRKGEFDRANALLDRSLADRQEVAAVHRVRSAIFRAGNQPERGFAELEAAARADPLNPKSFYFWAEALRRAGKLPEAVERLQEALARTNDPMEEDFYALKLRLVKIDLDRGAEFADELAANLPRPEAAPAEWLLTAAAAEIKRDDYAAAAKHLALAKERLSQGTASFLLNDQIFADQAWRKEIAPIFADTPRPTASAAPAPSSPPGLAGGRRATGRGGDDDSLPH